MMRGKFLLLPLCLFTFFAMPGAAQRKTTTTQLIAIKAGKLVDPESGKTSANQTILVDGATIKEIGAHVTIPTSARIIDLANSTVLPGMFDAHTHLCMTVQPRRDNGNYFFTTLLDTTAYRAIEGVANARAMLESGFTSVRDVGNAGNYADSDLRRAIEAGIVPGPTIVNAGVIIAPYGGQFQLQPEKRNLATPEYLFADTRDEMRKAIRENIHYGATVIKIVVDDQTYIYSVDDIRFMIAEAHASGLKLAAHCWTHPGAHNAAEAGVDSIEHGFRMTDEDLALAKKNNVVLVGTEFTDQMLKVLGGQLGEHSIWVDRLKRAYKIGVTMAFGTDVDVAIPGETRGTLAIGYIDSWVDAGVPPTDTLRALTINASRLLGVDKVRGALKPGLAADIIATPENPLDNIQTLKHVTFVMKDGAVIKQP
ncbi:MAG TPA: amidohydrolase family protein [Candidatus Dormibacteraeota bacterium]|nr:amidohydrolase family protein [Candidatus Dormibacteraeota bacterium]